MLGNAGGAFSRYPYVMVHIRSLSFVMLVVFLGVPCAVRAAGPTAQNAGIVPVRVVAFDDEQNDTASQAKDRGEIKGEVAEIDYGRGTITLQTQRGKIKLMVSPSTSILGRENDYGTIADIARGSRISAFISEVDGHLVAQIIHIH